MRLQVWGIMGGSFDPVHNGHLQMAECTLHQMRLDGVIWIPTGDPPHKSDLAPAQDRLRMVELATERHACFVASDMEITRNQTTYTVDTLRELHKQRPNDQFVYIIGADTLFHLETWRTFAEAPPLLKAFACVPRPGIDEREMLHQVDVLERKYPLKIALMRERGLDISSTQVRLAVERGLPMDDLVPSSVAQYIKERGLYRDPMLDELKRTLTESRYRHTLGVEQTAIELAQQYDVDPGKARIAALLHDCAKCMPEKDMKALLKAHNMLPKDPSSRTITLMHASAGMILAQERYGITDPDILSAIRWHTTGHANMTQLEKLIYLADVVEPGRRPFPSLDAIRKETWIDLNSGMRLAANRTLQYLKSRGIEPDPHTRELLNDNMED